MAGFIGTLSDAIVQIPAHLLLGTSTAFHYIGALMFHEKNLHLIELVIGFLTHLITGGLSGTFLAIIFRFFGEANPYGKSIGLAWLLWILHVVLIPNFIYRPLPYVTRSVPEVIVDLAAHTLIGLVTAWAWLKLGPAKENKIGT